MQLDVLENLTLSTSDKRRVLVTALEALDEEMMLNSQGHAKRHTPSKFGFANWNEAFAVTDAIKKELLAKIE